MKSIFIRDVPDGFEIILTDEDGQVGQPQKITNMGLLDLDANIGQFKRLALQRIKNVQHGN